MVRDFGFRVEGFDHLSIDGLQGGMGMGEEAESRSEPVVDVADGDPQTQTSGGYFEAHWAPWKRQPGATPSCFRNDEPSLSASEVYSK